MWAARHALTRCLESANSQALRPPSPGHKCQGYEQRPLKGASSRIHPAPFLAGVFMPGRGGRRDRTVQTPAELAGAAVAIIRRSEAHRHARQKLHARKIEAAMGLESSAEI